MDYAPQARDLYDGWMPDGDMVGFCADCDREIRTEEPVYHCVHDIRSVTLRCVACQMAGQASAA